MIERYFGPGWRAYIPGAALVLVQFVLVGIALAVDDFTLKISLTGMSLLIGVLAASVVAGAIRMDKTRARAENTR